MILIDDCVLINGEKGITIISIKTKEIIQYIESFKNFQPKIIFKSDNGIINLYLE